MAWGRHNSFTVVLLFCLLLSTSRSVAAVDNSTANDSGYLRIEHNGITYHVYADEVTWQEAYSLCKAELSVLAKIPDQETQDVITTHLNNDGVLATGSFWIDAKDDNEEGVWVDSESNELTYTAWAPGEPNNADTRENCAHLWWEHDFKWNDKWCESHIYFICQTGKTGCYATDNGYDYRGTVSTTETGLECQYWSEQTPHPHRTPKAYPFLKGHNYCRNLGGSNRPWCYTTDPDTRWEKCAVGNRQPMCNKDDIECYERDDGRDYRGHVNVTVTGKTCQMWSAQTPHRHRFRIDNYIGEHNYCRNPNNSRRPWCYTMDPGILWQFCDVCGDGKTFTSDNIALNKHASQSSLFSERGVASNAVDGFASTFWGDESCTHTNIEQDPWWQVDLEYTYFVTEVVITNRRDCCSVRLEGAVVRVGSSIDIGSNRQCGGTVSPYTANELASISFKCASGTVGRYISVQLEGKNQVLTLCEVEVHGKRAKLSRWDQRCGPRYKIISSIDGECNPGSSFPCCSPFGWCGRSSAHCKCPTCIDYRKVYKKDDSQGEEEEPGEKNLAILKEATQSSLFGTGVASNAVDGRKNSAWVDKSCTHTLKDDEAWWKVDLVDVYPIDRVVITNRGDCCKDRLQGAVVRVGIQENIKRNNKCGDTLSVDDVNDRPIIFKCNGVSGHVVSVQLEGRTDALTLCEVEVYKYEGEKNLAILKEATQSSLFGTGVASNAVDGRKNSAFVDKSCTHTLEDDDAWWKVDLGDVYPIDRVVITNRGDCCQDRLQGAVVRVGIQENIKRNVKCGDTLSADHVSDRPITFECNGVTGHVVSVQLEERRDYLTLCEVEVYKSEGGSWRDDLRCGPEFTAPNGVSPAECNPHGIYPCCSTANWCGISDDHCKCDECIDYREVYKVNESPVDACSEPKRITIPDDGEVTVTSPAYPIFYPNYANCRWFITAETDLDIEVTVNKVDLETCCANVYIGTGDTLRLNELFTITNTMTTSTVAESNKMWIQFVSSASQVKQGEGFSITLKPKSRGGIAPSCVSRWSEKSGSSDDMQVEIECDEGEVMTSCNSVTKGSESHGTRDGERIIQVTSKPTCVAQNGEGGLGVYAVARCCKWSGLQCLYIESVQKSGTEDDDVAEAMCDMSVNDLPTSTLGCMAHTYSQWLDGARPWTVSDDFLTNSQMDFVRNGCVAQNGIYGNGVLSEASCCSAPGLQCQHIYSHRSDGTSGAVAHVQCEEGWVMTGCSVFTYWGVTDGAYVTDDGMCKAINGGEASMGNNTRGVWAVAVCCKSSDQLQ
ncbi:uncharacterized protein [Ptychodera flava]|uniref:uncharacterized protein isoform X5 n=1 Tax=Ptychodera flava TaxID=63121 RepID=UPI00396A56C0